MTAIASTSNLLFGITAAQALLELPLLADSSAPKAKNRRLQLAVDRSQPMYPIYCHDKPSTRGGKLGGRDTLPGSVAGKRFPCRKRRSDLAGYTYHLEAGRFFGK
jgi:hypothetical protein